MRIVGSGNHSGSGSRSYKVITLRRPSTPLEVQRVYFDQDDSRPPHPPPYERAQECQSTYTQHTRVR